MGTGGMRWGAGRPGWHAKAEHCRQIDARRWAREGILGQRRNGGWAWSDPETKRQTASIGYASDGACVTLTYSMGDTPFRQSVPILSTRCHYGGRRFWFGCPFCAQRVAVLYLRQHGFACRHCHRLVYASQSEDAIGRAWRKQQKLEQKLAPYLVRPKRMRRSTHERLVEQIADCEKARDDALAQALARMGFPL